MRIPERLLPRWARPPFPLLRRRMPARGAHVEAVAGHLAVGPSDEPPDPRPLVLLMFTNRCGSNLLSEYLVGAGIAGPMGEALNGPALAALAERHGLSTVPEVMRHLAHRSDARLPGVKASSQQLRMLIDWGVPAQFAGLRLVHLSRADKVAQAVSYVIARQTGRWTSRQEGTLTEPVYDAAAIEVALAGFLRQDAEIDLLATLYRLPVLRLGYEELVADPGATVARVATFLGQDLSGWSPPARTRLACQADARNAAFADRFRAELLPVLARI